MSKRLTTILAAFILLAFLFGCSPTNQAETEPAATGSPVAALTVQVTVDGIERSAWVYPGKQALTEESPLILAFHGYSGKAKAFSGGLKLHEAWPRATVAYMQGLMIPERSDSRIEPGNERAGWQRRPGMDDNRDVRFVDAMIAELSKQYRVDRQRIYATGFSNGAIFTWVLLCERPQVFAAFAPIAGHDNGMLEGATVPRPVIGHFGREDQAIRFRWAQKSLARILRLNKCNSSPIDQGDGYMLHEPDAGGAEVMWHVHNGGHRYGEQTASRIVQFFYKHELPET